MVETMKKCNKCGQVKHRREFHVDRSRKDDLSPWCKKCRSARQAERNVESAARNAASPFAHLSLNQKGNFAEDLAMHYYHEKGYYCTKVDGDGPKIDFIALGPAGDVITVQVKLASWESGNLRTSMSSLNRDAYLAAGVSELFVVHPTEPYGWRMPMRAYAKKALVTAKGADNYAEYKVILPLHFTQAYIDSIKEQDDDIRGEVASRTD